MAKVKTTTEKDVKKIQAPQDVIERDSRNLKPAFESNSKVYFEPNLEHLKVKKRLIQTQKVDVKPIKPQGLHTLKKERSPFSAF